MAIYEKTFGLCKSDWLDLEALVDSYDATRFVGIKLDSTIPYVMELFVGHHRTIEPTTKFARRWKEVVGETLIPYDRKARRDLIDRVSKNPKLCEYVKNWQKMDAQIRGTG